MVIKNKFSYDNGSKDELIKYGLIKLKNYLIWIMILAICTNVIQKNIIDKLGMEKRHNNN